MKQFALSFLILLLGALTASAQDMAQVDKFEISSTELGQEREFLVYTPAFYKDYPLVNYDVIYIFDCNNREFLDFVTSSVSFLSGGRNKYIVVGIVPTYIESSNYGRNNDLLPAPINVDPKDFFGGGNYGGRDNFMRYIKNEIVPYIDGHYQTTSRRIAIGHSLSASFVISCLIEEPELFDDYIAVSPNLAYDKERLAIEFISLDFNKLKDDTFLYVSSADEDDYWQGWGEANRKFYSFINGPEKPRNMTIHTNQFPEQGHWSTFAYSIMDALPYYFEFSEEKKNKYSEESYEVTITLRVPNETDTVYITGNQPELAQWDPATIMMEKISAYERQVKLKIHSPAQIKFTRGDWDTQGSIAGNDGYENLFLHPEKQKDFSLEIALWLDEEED